MAKTEKSDNFLADAVRKKHEQHLNVMDGFRFGIGFFVALLLMSVVLGALTWGLILAMNPR